MMTPQEYYELIIRPKAITEYSDSELYETFKDKELDDDVMDLLITHERYELLNKLLNVNTTEF